jgi:hypothetical protein
VVLAVAVCSLLVQGPAASAQSTPVSPSPGVPACRAESEPDDAPAQAPQLSGELCLTGTLPGQTDQDLFIWELTPTDALSTWTFSISGVPHTITSIHVIPITSAPNDPNFQFGSGVARIDSNPDEAAPGVQSGVALAPGRYVLGISRGNSDQGTPDPNAQYTAVVTRDETLPPNGDVEPNDDATHATSLAASISLVGDLQGSVDVYRWTLSTADATHSWQLDARTLPGQSLALALTRPDGTALGLAQAGSDGIAHLRDLRLAEGDYLVTLSPAASQPVPYLLSSLADQDPTADPEPNNTPALAAPLAVGQPVTGRLAPPEDTDDWRLHLDASAAADQVRASLTGAPGSSYTMCLLGSDGSQLQCHTDTSGVTLDNLLLPAGDYTLSITGTTSLTDHYTLAVTDLGPPTAGREVEPDDTTSTASPLDSTVVLTGSGAPGDQDMYHVVTSGTPHEWRLDAVGTGLMALEWISPDGTVLATGDISADQTHASLWDMPLIPGNHWFHVRANTGTYTLTFTDLGTQATGQETEPNDTAVEAEALTIGQARTGRLPTPSDVDTDRFTLTTPEHIRIDVTPPSDAAIAMRLVWGPTEVARLRDPQLGEHVVWDGLLQPGDYTLSLTSTSGSVEPYTLLVSHEDPFAVSGDLEPNDLPAQARPLPASLEVNGSGWGTAGEDDWYAIPPTTTNDPVTIESSGPITRFRVLSGSDPVHTSASADGATLTVDPVPAGTALTLGITSHGAYQLKVGGGGLAPAMDALASITSSLTTDDATIAAFETFGQAVPATLAIVNAGQTDQSVLLDARSSAVGWRVELPTDPVTVGAGQTVSVPIVIHAPADIPLGVASVVTVRARSAADVAAPGTAGSPTAALPAAQSATAAPDVTASLGITADADAQAVGPEQAWPVPDALLGGLDVASTALGASVVNAANATAEAQLHDGIVLSGIGWSGLMVNQTPTLTVQLAGDGPVPVVGMLLDPLAGNNDPGSVPHDVDLLLSTDGTTWVPALHAELSSWLGEQAFVLPAPVQAHFAQLRIDSVWGSENNTAWLGEWKVVAAPGTAPAGAVVNLADPAMGGHVVYIDPGVDNDAEVQGMLTEGATPAYSPALDTNSTVRWVIGFRDDRAAQITRLEWVDPPSSNPATRFAQVDVEVSTGSPLGPWQALATWQLTRVADGSVSALDLPQPTWARFLRFTGKGPTDKPATWELPATLRVLERPVDATYRSAVGEWGQDRPQGPYEWLVPPDLSQPPSGPDGNETPDTATPLAVGTPATGTVQRDRDVDWYAVTIPADQNTLTLTLSGPPPLGVVLSVTDDGGNPVALQPGPDTGPGIRSWTADVQPGATYRVEIQQPTLWVTLTYDTSGSLGADLPFITEAIRTYAGGIVPGQESLKVLPFEERSLLQQWSDQPWEIENAINSVFQNSGSSGAEASMLAADGELGSQAGDRAMLVLTDGETTTYNATTQLWQNLDQVRPHVFTVQVGGSGLPGRSTELMQDWAMAWGGDYQYAISHDDVDEAFARMATWLRRPAAYTVLATASQAAKAPGTLSVVPPTDTSGKPVLVPVGKDVAVELVLDTSGSMLDRLHGSQRRIDAAKSVLTDLVTHVLPAGIPVMLRTFDPKPGSCDSVLTSPLAPLDPTSMAGTIAALTVNPQTRTPLGAVLLAVGNDLSAISGPRIVVLVTDGEETCHGNPLAAAKALGAQGLDVHINIVGFAINSPKLRAELAQWASLGHGTSFNASNASGLASGIDQALTAPYRVFDSSGKQVATGVVGGPAIGLPSGVYRVEVLTDPVRIIDNVEIGGGAAVSVTVPAPGT